MTRDDVLEEAAQEVGRPKKTEGNSYAERAAAAERIRALKSRVPERSPEVDIGPDPRGGDALRRQYVDLMARRPANPLEIVAPVESKPPEKSPEVEEAAAANRRIIVSLDQDVARLLLENDELRSERDYFRSLCIEGGHEMRRRLGGAEEVGLKWLRERDQARAECDALKAQLEATDRLAKESIARVEALTAEVQRHKWRVGGAKMKGEA